MRKTPKKGTILHVGYTKSWDDMQRVVYVSHWLASNVQENLSHYTPTFIDLNDGQDFLTMTDTHNIVVLHFICRWEKFQQERQNKVMRTSPQLNVSVHAKWFNWRVRLGQTKANYIFLFGGAGEVGGSYICNIDDYKGTKELGNNRDEKEELWVFKKLDIL